MATWRHDSVSATLKKPLENLVQHLNATNAKEKCESKRKVRVTPLPQEMSGFVRAGEKKTSEHNKRTMTESDDLLLKHHNDWVLRVEMGKEKMEFPPSICVTELRPDIV